MSGAKRDAGFATGLRREVERLDQRVLFRVVCFGLPLFCALFMATVFGDGEMNELPVGVVDHDFSATSRDIVRSIDSSPKLAAKGHYTSYSEAATDLRRGKIYGFVIIPHNFEQDLLAERQPTIEGYYQYALMSAGAQVASTLDALLATLSVGPMVQTATQLAISPQATEALLMPIEAGSEPLFNPTLSYSLYLSAPFFFVMFQIVVLLFTVYSIGSEIKFSTAKEWLTSAGGKIGTAVVSKLAPHTIIFTAMGILAQWILGWSGAFTTPNDWWATALYTLLLVVASQSLGLFIFSIYPAMGIVISVVSMIGSLGATLCGVTFPLGSMAPFIKKAALALPIRQFMLLLQGEPYLHTTPEWIHIATLAGFCLLPLPLMPRLRRAITSGRYEKIS